MQFILLLLTIAQAKYWPEESNGAMLAELMSKPLYGGAISNIFRALWADLTHKRLPLPEAAGRSVPDQIRDEGMNFESFNVTTQDGYINTLWHVWDPSADQKLNPESGEQRVAFMQHGLIDIAGTWFFNNATNSVASNLVKEGYDVWFGNNRGTTQSFLHVNLTVEDDAYWNYSFDEMGKYDLPANIEFVLEKTNVSKITYMGHS